MDEDQRKRHNAYASAWYYRNRERAKASMLRFRTANRERIAHKERLRHYGLTQASYEAMLKSQNNLCASCEGPLIRPHVDHDHGCCKVKAYSCGKCIRGILCERCNLGLGNFGDSRELLLKAAEYLERYCH